MTGVQTCALPIWPLEVGEISRGDTAKGRSPVNSPASAVMLMVDQASSSGCHKQRVDYQMVGASREVSARQTTEVHLPRPSGIGNRGFGTATGGAGRPCNTYSSTAMEKGESCSPSFADKGGD